MNFGRLAVAAIAATVVDGVYGFVVWGKILNSEFARYPAIYRDAGDVSGFPLMFAAIFVAMCFATVVYARGYEGGSGLSEGLKFGAILAAVVAGYFAGANFGTMRIGKKMAMMYGAGAFGEWLIAGAIIGLVYKPAIRSR
jgi:hypothetical protein